MNKYSLDWIENLWNIYSGQYCNYIFYPVIRNAIVVIIIITSITNSILVVVLLPRVGKIGAIVLQKE